MISQGLQSRLPNRSNSSQIPGVRIEMEEDGRAATSFLLKYSLVLIYYEIEFESACGFVGCKISAAIVASTVLESACGCHPDELTEEFASSLRSGTVTALVGLPLFTRRRIFVRLRLPNQRTKFPAKMSAAPSNTKRNDSERMPSKFWLGDQ
jgi:hypothetical protein